MNMNYICYVAGKSGGHIIPALTHAQQELQKNLDTHIVFISTTSALDRSLLEKNSLITHYFPFDLSNIPGKNIFYWPKFFMNMMKTLYSSFLILYRYRPAKVVSMGGYISIPVCYVAWLLRIPVELYELNVVPGKAVKLLCHVASVTKICFEQTRSYLPKQVKCQLSVYPLRFGEQHKLSPSEARKLLGITNDKKILLVLGGSQGSRFINEILQKIVSGIQNQLFIIHQTGAADVHWVHEGYAKQAVEALVFAYRDDMHVCYAAADMVIARAGAGTLFEVDFFRKKSFIIPLELTSTSHQVDNAHAFATNNDSIKVYRQRVLEHDYTPLQEWVRLSL